MTMDQNGTWEMEKNENFDGYMKALGKKEAKGRTGRASCFKGLWPRPPDSATVGFLQT